VKFVVKITLKEPPPPPPSNTPQAETRDEYAWRHAIGVGAFVAAGVIIAVVVVQDVVTGGAGAVDNPFFGGIAARLAIWGANMLRMAPVAASVPVTVTIER
jgi:hypothetical protein